MINEVYTQTGIPVITGGLIRTDEQIKQAFDAGAIAITTSNKELWKRFQKVVD